MKEEEPNEFYFLTKEENQCLEANMVNASACLFYACNICSS